MTEACPRVSVSRTPSALRFSNIASGRGTIARQPRTTMTRSPGARNSRGPRDHSTNPTNRSSFQYHIYHESKNIDYFPNKRGIIRCQAWRLQHPRPKQKMSELFSKIGQVKPNKRKIQYPYCSGESEIYCPRCDMFFDSMWDYQDHLLIKAMKAPHVTKIKELKAQAEMQQSVKQQVSHALMRKTIHNRLNSSFDEDYEFSDDRNKRIMHWDNNKRHYSSGELLEEVRDARDQARAIRLRRTGLRRNRNTVNFRNLAPIAEILTRFKSLASQKSREEENASLEKVSSKNTRNRAILV